MFHVDVPSGGPGRGITLRLALTLSFVALILLCGGLIGYFSMENSRQAVLEVADQLRVEALKRVEQHLTGFLDVPHQINQANAQALASGILDVRDPVKRQRYFHGVVAAHPMIAYSFFGMPDGEFYGARRAPNGDIEVIHAGPETGQASTYHATTAIGDRAEFRAAYPNFDPRTRPWYKAGEDAPGPVWSPVYRHFVLKDLTITASLAVRRPDGGLVGVFAVDYALTNIHQFLTTINIGPSGEVFLMERGGELLAAAHAQPGGFFLEKDGAFSRVMAADSPLPRVAAAARLLSRLPGGLDAISGEETLEFTLGGERQFLQAKPFQDPRGIDWLMVAVAAEKDFIGRIQANTRQTVVMIALAVAAAALAGVLIAARLTRPVELLAQAAGDLSRGRFDLDIPTPKSRELRSLSRAFASMAGQLRESFEELSAKSAVIALHNKTLEARVASRTAELNHLHDRLRAMFEAIPGFVHVIDKNFTIVDAGDTLLAALGLPRDKVLGRKCFEVFHGASSVCRHCPLADERRRDAIAIRASLPEEEALFGAALMIYSSPIRDQEGEVWGFIECLMDVSALRAAERDLTAAKDAAERANRSKTDFLAKMSHDIRTPLNAIIGLTELTLEGRLAMEQRDHLETVLESARTLLDLVSDLLDYSKIEARGVKIARAHFSLPKMLAAAAGTFKLAARKKGLRLTVRIDKDCPRHVEGDQAHLRQILANLISNAIKFTQAGSVDIRAGRLPGGPNGGPGGPDGPVRLLFSVADTGIGIAEEDLDHIFEPFRQADAAIGARYGGTGLGLAICRQLAGLMGGLVRVDSRLGHGSTFYLEIPLRPGDRDKAREQSPDRRASIAELRASQRPLRILLAEDNPVNVKLATSLLIRLGHDPATAANGRLALERLGAERFDLVLMDLEMPEMDGLTATRLIREGRAGEEAKTVPILALSAHVLDEIILAAKEAGVNGFVAKPIDFAMLAKALADFGGLPDARGSHEAEPARELLPAPPDSPLDDEAALKRLAGDRELLDELRQAVLDMLPERRRELELAFAAGDGQKLHTVAHGLKSALAAIGALAASNLASELERTSLQIDLADRASLHAKLQRELARVENELRA